MLAQHKAYVFSLIQKFNTNVNPAQGYSQRDDIIVITDEAHRTQYGTLALNMRMNALPNASYIGFTGTPLFKRNTAWGGPRDFYTVSSYGTSINPIQINGYWNSWPNNPSPTRRLWISNVVVADQYQDVLDYLGLGSSTPPSGGGCILQGVRRQ